jgi:hypothetical protein
MSEMASEGENHRDTRARALETMRRDGFGAGAFAIACELDPRAVHGWLDGNSDEPAIRRAIFKLLRDRAAWFAGLSRVDAGEERRRQERELHEKAVAIGTEMIGAASDGERAVALRDYLAMLVGDLARLGRLPAPKGVCFRCGADQSLPDEIESELVNNERRAAWAAWLPDLYYTKLRAVMKPGDRVGWIEAGRIFIHRPDGSVIEVRRFDG